MGLFLRLSCAVICAFGFYMLWQIVVNHAWP
jgi:hypothetical protein